MQKFPNINYNILGIANETPKWNYDYFNELSKCKIALNLSRGKPAKYYSSNRIASIMGNGLLTFVHEKTCFGDFISNDKIIYYQNLDDLGDKLKRYKKDHKARKLIAKNGKDFYMSKLNSTLISEFILSKTMNFRTNKKFIWVK